MRPWPRDPAGLSQGQLRLCPPGGVPSLHGAPLPLVPRFPLLGSDLLRRGGEEVAWASGPRSPARAGGRVSGALGRGSPEADVGARVQWFRSTRRRG